jgi:hypothetical protein
MGEPCDALARCGGVPRSTAVSDSSAVALATRTTEAGRTGPYFTRPRAVRLSPFGDCYSAFTDFWLAFSTTFGIGAKSSAAPNF